MALFGKKKALIPERPTQPMQPAPADIPTEQVIQLRQQGMQNNQIIQTLQNQGYNSAQIFDAISQADIKGVVGSQEAAPVPAAAQPTAPMPPVPEAPPIQPAPAPSPEIGRERIEEVAESIIDEKWDELMKSVDKIVAWKETVESKMTKIEQSISNLKERFEELHTGILGKIGEYDKGIRDVGAELKAMQGVFKKVLPTFTENVSELSRITKGLKGKKKR